MNEPSPNYRMYSIEQLTDALEHIDKDRFPDRVLTIKQYLENPGPRGHKIEDKRINIDGTVGTIFGLIGMEFLFWLIIGVLALLGFAVC